VYGSQGVRRGVRLVWPGGAGSAAVVVVVAVVAAAAEGCSKSVLPSACPLHMAGEARSSEFYELVCTEAYQSVHLVRQQLGAPRK